MTYSQSTPSPPSSHHPLTLPRLIIRETPRGCAFWNILDEGKIPPILPPRPLSSETSSQSGVENAPRLSEDFSKSGLGVEVGVGIRDTNDEEIIALLADENQTHQQQLQKQMVDVVQSEQVHHEHQPPVSPHQRPVWMAKGLNAFLHVR